MSARSLRRNITVYTYDSDIEELYQHFDYILERETINEGTYRENECTFAYDPLTRRRIPLANKTNTVYHDRDKHQYRIWYYSGEGNKSQAIQQIADYILEHIAPVIRNSEIFLELVQKKRDNAVSLLESIR